MFTAEDIKVLKNHQRKLNEIFYKDEEFSVDDIKDVHFAHALDEEISEAKGWLNLLMWKNGGVLKENVYYEDLSDYQIRNIRMEMIDCLHFILSFPSLDPIFCYPYYTNSQIQGEECLVRVLNSLRGRLMLNDHPNVFGLITYLMEKLGMDKDTILKYYFGKQCLNEFRRSHGYGKEGSTYRKMWDGEEDNEYLITILDIMDPPDLDEGSIHIFKTNVVHLLDQTYASF